MVDNQGGSQIDPSIQTSSPGCSIGEHSYPYGEYVSVLKCEGMAWTIKKQQSRKTIFNRDPRSSPPNVLHRFRTTGKVALKTSGVHVLANYIIIRN